MSELDSVVACEDVQLGTTGCVYVTIDPLAPVRHDNTVVGRREKAHFYKLFLQPHK